MLSNFGKYAVRFEEKAQEYFGNPWTRCLVNCDIGLVLSLAALELPEGSECLVQSFTFNSTVNAILWNRLRRCSSTSIRARSTWTPPISSAGSRRRPAPWSSPTSSEARFDDRGRDGDGFAGRDSRSSSTPPTPTGRRTGVSRSARRGLGDFQVFSFSGTKQLDLRPKGGLVAAADAPRAREESNTCGPTASRTTTCRGFVGINGKLSETPRRAGLSGRRGHDRGGRSRRVNAKARAIPGPRSGAGRGHSIPGTPAASATSRRTRISQSSARSGATTRDDLCEDDGVQTKKYFRPLHGMPAFRALSVAGRRSWATPSAVADARSCVCRCSTSWPTPTSTG